MSTTPRKVLMFGTCLLDLFRPEAGLAALRLIERAGFRPVFPQDQSCCGQPAFNSGYRREALAVARAQLPALTRDGLPVVVPSASCAGMIRNHWPELFADQPEAARVRALAERTFELCAFLDAHELPLRDTGAPLRVALHHSCSARRETHSAPAATRLLARLAHVEVAEPAHAGECCGFGGTFAVKQDALSAAMADAKCDALLACDAQRLISQDAGCLLHLDGRMRRRGDRLPVQHIAEFLLERGA